MEGNMIKVFVEYPDGEVSELECPTDMGYSLMEMMKVYELPVLATCGGMALCATCCVDVVEGLDELAEIGDDEYAMLDTLPDLLPNSRLACQLPVNAKMNNLRVKLHHAE